MPTNYPSTGIWLEMAELIGCDVPTIKAVFEVEAAGKFYDSKGRPIRRFEPHHYPREHWGELGFNPGNTAPWRASFKLRTSTRRQMFDIAQRIDAEKAAWASSWGAPQIMGFNCALAGYDTALDMVDAFEQSADEQIRAFVNFCISADLDTHLRSQDWYSFARGYNGSGQARRYAGLIETAYRRQSGGAASSPVLRVGSRGQAVHEMQIQLQGLGYEIDADGVFGAGTKRIVEEFQRAEGLTVDGIAGATTLGRIERESGEHMQIDRSERAETSGNQTIDTVVKHGSAVLGSGGAVGLISNVSETNQTIIIGGVVVGAIILAALWLLKKKG